MPPVKSNQREKEISDLINAVKEHKKFKQLACYSIQALDKACNPLENRNTWRESVALAIRLDAAAVICDILQRHPGHENVLVVCVECMRKLAIDKANAVVIAENSAVPYLLESIKANPELPEETLHMAMSLLSNLCSHTKVSAMVLNEDTLTSVLGVLESNRDPLVLTSCISIIDKMSKQHEQQVANNGGGNFSRGSTHLDPEARAKFESVNRLLNEKCVPAILKGLEGITRASAGADGFRASTTTIIDGGQAEEFVVSITRILGRLANGSESVREQLKTQGGIDAYLAVAEKYKDNDRVGRGASKLISKMLGGNVRELLETLKSGGLSDKAEERVLSLVASMSMEAATMDEIMQVQGGVATLVKAMGGAKSNRALEEAARTVARLAASPKNVPQLIETGALQKICDVIAHGGRSFETSDMQASMVVALNRIVAQSSGSSEASHAAVMRAVTVDNPGVVAKLAEALEKDAGLASSSGVVVNSTQMKATLELFGRLNQDHLKCVDVKAVAGSVFAAMKAVEGNGSGGEAALVTKASLMALRNLVHAGGEGGAAASAHLVQCGAVPVVLKALTSPAANESAAVAVAALGILGGLAGGGESLASFVQAQAHSVAGIAGEVSAGIGALREAGSFGVVVDCVGNHLADSHVRAAAADLLQVIATDSQIDVFSQRLAKFSAAFVDGNATQEQIAAIPKLALGLGALAMVPSNIAKIQAAGGVAPITTLMGAVAEMKDCPNQAELLCTFSNCLTEVVANTDSGSAPATTPTAGASAAVAGVATKGSGLDPATVMQNCVRALTKHEGKAEVCTATLRLMRTALASAKLDYEAKLAAAAESGDSSAVEAFLRSEEEKGGGGYASALVACGGVDAIATQIRLHPSDENPELLAHALAVYAQLAEDPLAMAAQKQQQQNGGSSSGKSGGSGTTNKKKNSAATAAAVSANAHHNQRATDIVQRSGRQLVRCLEETAALRGDDPAALAALVPCLAVFEQCALTPQGRAITSKLGAIQSVMAVLDAASSLSSQDDGQGQVAGVVAACVRTLTAVVTSSDVVRVVERLHKRLQELKDVGKGQEGGEADAESHELRALSAVSEDVKKLGLLSMIGDFSKALLEAGGQQVLVDIICEVEEGGDQGLGANSSAKEDLVRQCLTAFGRSLAAGSGQDGQGLRVEGVRGIVPALVRCLEEPTVEDLVTVSLISACDANLMNELVRAGAVEAIVPLLEGEALEELLADKKGGGPGGGGEAAGASVKGSGDDSETKQSSDVKAGLNACMKALAAFCLSSEGVSHVVGSGGLAFVVGHLREDMAIRMGESNEVGMESASKAIAAAVVLLRNVAENGGGGGGDITQRLLSAGVLGLVGDSLSMLQAQSSSSAEDVAAMADLQILLATLIAAGGEGAGSRGNAEVAASIISSGILQQVDSLMSSQSSAFVASPQCVLATNALLNSLNASGQSDCLHTARNNNAITAATTTISGGSGSGVGAVLVAVPSSSSSSSSSPSPSSSLAGIDAQALMMRMMNANSNDITIARACAQTVGVLYSTGPEAATAAAAATAAKGGAALPVKAATAAMSMFAKVLAESDAALIKATASAAVFQSGGSDGALLAQSAEALATDLACVATSLQLLGNLVLIEQAVDQEAVNKAMAIAQPLLQLVPSVKKTLRETAAANGVEGGVEGSSSSVSAFQLGAAGDAASASALTLCGRLADLAHVEVDAVVVTEATALLIEDDTVSDVVFSSAVSCLGGLASSQRGVKAIAKRGMVAKMLSKTTQRKRGAMATGGTSQLQQGGGLGGARSKAEAAADQMAAVTAAALDAIKKQAVSNAASLVAAEGGAAAIATIVVAIAEAGKSKKDKRDELAETLSQIVSEQGGLQVLLQVLCEMNTGPPLSNLFAAAGGFSASGGGGSHVRVAVDAIVAAMLEHRDSGKATIQVHSPAEAASLVAAAGLSQPASSVAAENEKKHAGRKQTMSRKHTVSSLSSSSAAQTISPAELAVEQSVFLSPASAAVVLLEGLAESAGGVLVCAATPSVLEALVTSCSSPNAAVANASMGCLARLASLNAPHLNERLTETRAATRALVLLKELLVPVGAGGNKKAQGKGGAVDGGAATPPPVVDLERKGRPFLDSAVYTLATLLATVGAKPCNLAGRDTMRTVKALHACLEEQKGNPFALDQCGRALSILETAFEDGADAALEAALRALSKLDKQYRAWQGVEDEKGEGGAYFYNASTAATIWERPPEYQKLVEDLGYIVELVETVGGSLENVEPKVVAFGLIPLLSSHARDKLVMATVCSLLKIATSSGSGEDSSGGGGRAQQLACSVLARHELIGDVVVVLENHLTVDGEQADGVCKSCAAVIHRLSPQPRFANALGNADYLAVLTAAIQHYSSSSIDSASDGDADSENANVCERLLRALSCVVEGDAHNAKLAFDPEKVQCVATVAKCFQVFNASHRQVSSASLALVEALLACVDEFGDDEEEPFGDDEQRDALKLHACKACCPGLLKGLELYGCEAAPLLLPEAEGGIGGPNAGGGEGGGLGEDGEGEEEECAYFLSAVRCLGSLSLVDDCIVVMVEGGACRLTVKCLRRWHAIAEAASSSMELVSNMGAIEDDDLDEAMTAYLIEEEALEAVVEVMAEYDTEVPVLLVTYEALYNIGNDEKAAGKLVEMGVVKLAFTAIQNFDYEKLLVAQVMKFLSVLTYDSRAVTEVAELGWLPIVFQALQTSQDLEEFVLDGLMCVCNAVQDPRSQKLVLENRELLKQMLELLNRYADSSDVASQVIITCIRLSTNEEVSVLMAAEGMPYFMRTTAHLGMADTELLSLLFQLLFYLAFVKENIKVIVQHGGIKVLCAVMEVEEYQQNVPLMLKAVGMMDNVVSASEEFASVVADKRGRELVEELREGHGEDEEELFGAATSALLSMDAMTKKKEQEGSKTGRAALYARLGADAVSLGAGAQGGSQKQQQGDEGGEVEAAKDYEGPDPLAVFRALLLRGAPTKIWTKGVPGADGTRLFVTEEVNAIILKDLDAKGRAGTRIALKTLGSVKGGAHGEGHLKKGTFGSSCKEPKDRCLSIFELVESSSSAGKELYALSFQSKEACEKWTAALTALVEVAQNSTHRLKG